MYDRHRSEYIRSLGLDVIRFTNNQIEKRMDVVLDEPGQAVEKIKDGS